MPHKPDTPCARCGTLLWSSSSSLPAGQRVCHPCRSIEPAPNRKLIGPRRPRRPRRPNKRTAVLCVTCGSRFHTGNAGMAKYCSDECRPYVVRVPTDSDRRRWGKRGSTADRGYDHQWRLIRAQVIAEETNCGFCDEPVDKSLKWPNPWSPAVDHRVRQEHGGTRDRDNLRLSHLGCNAAGRARNESRRAGLVKCEVCGNSFKRHDDRQRTCSRACGAALQVLNS